MNKKQVKKTSSSQNFYFTIYEYIKNYNKLPDWEELGLNSKQSLSYHIKPLREAGFVHSPGYGTWVVLKDFNINELKQVKKFKLGNSRQLTDKDVRGHAFMFKLAIPTISNWKKRHEYLSNKGINYKPLKYGQRITYQGRKIHLYDTSIIIYEQESYISNLAKNTKSLAIYNFLRLIKHLESFFELNFKINKRYKFRVCREHYALIKNCLAKQFDKEGKRLYVFCSKGLWLIIDNSYNLHEKETVLLDDAIEDNEGIQKYWNEHKNTGFQVTPNFILSGFEENNKKIAELVEDRKFWAEHQRSHVKSIQELGKNSEILGSAVIDLTKTINLLSKKVEKLSR